MRKFFSPNSQLPQYWSVGSEIASMDIVKMDFEKVYPWFSEKKISPNSQLPQCWSVGSEIASMDLVKMDFEKVDPWF